MIQFVLGAAIGYVLGARAGRERYEQIARTYRRLADHPAVQGAAGIAKARMLDSVSGNRPPARHTANGNH
ncbi:hypothetical protein GCM10023321_59890 [Pseudonocardia eucalypti]|uniref:YtxH domain-containing protein n=1 Tax=Pseudonocardia eucalypti TaxID=648755 RepID=A0ABP9QU28_9PSEU|nr:hypothetical protein [Pseudonocardia eucalypti]